MVYSSDVRSGAAKGGASSLPHPERDSLTKVISSEIVPRLLMLHGADTASNPAAVDSNQIHIFCQLAIGPEPQAASAYFVEMQANGHSVDSLFVHLLAPTARYLGKMWEEDQCDFIDVTLGVARMQEILASSAPIEESFSFDLHHRALLIAPPGEKHVFGLEMVSRFMNNAGWDVTLERATFPKHSEAIVAREWVGVVGFSLSAESGLEALARMITALRRASTNGAVGVMVGGPLFNTQPELAIQVGADGSASDAPSAVILAKQLLMRQASRRALA